MFYRTPTNLKKSTQHKYQRLIQFVCVIVIFGCAMQSVFGLPVREKNKVRSAKEPAVFEREVVVSPVNGVESGFLKLHRVYNM